MNRNENVSRRMNPIIYNNIKDGTYSEKITNEAQSWVVEVNVMVSEAVVNLEVLWLNNARQMQKLKITRM